jgi:hypothetical protein
MRPSWRDRDCRDLELDPIPVADKHCLPIQIKQGIKTSVTPTHVVQLSFSDNYPK